MFLAQVLFEVVRVGELELVVLLRDVQAKYACFETQWVGATALNRLFPRFAVLRLRHSENIFTAFNSEPYRLIVQSKVSAPDEFAFLVLFATEIDGVLFAACGTCPTKEVVFILPDHDSGSHVASIVVGSTFRLRPRKVLYLYLVKEVCFRVLPNSWCVDGVERGIELVDACGDRQAYAFWEKVDLAVANWVQ